MFPLKKQKLEALQQRLHKLNILEDQLIEKFILGSGPGGQKINKTASCVYLKHLPSGIEVKCGRTRSRELNRFYARRELCERLEKKLFGKKTDREITQLKIRKQKQRKVRRQKKRESNS